MKLKHVLTVLACGLAIVSLKPLLWAAEPGADTRPPGDSPNPEGKTPGRFLVEVGGGGGAAVVMRIDTFTGKTWRLDSFPVNVKGADGATKTMAFDTWTACLERDAMEKIREKNPAPAKPALPAPPPPGN